MLREPCHGLLHLKEQLLGLYGRLLQRFYGGLPVLGVLLGGFAALAHQPGIFPDVADFPFQLVQDSRAVFRLLGLLPRTLGDLLDSR
ncbi:hypothetical protein D3C81_1930980 [compost metagenome]